MGESGKESGKRGSTEVVDYCFKVDSIYGVCWFRLTFVSGKIQSIH